MKKFKISVPMYYVQGNTYGHVEYEIEAESKEKAIEIAKKSKCGEIVIDDYEIDYYDEEWDELEVKIINQSKPIFKVGTIVSNAEANDLYEISEVYIQGSSRNIYALKSLKDHFTYGIGNKSTTPEEAVKDYFGASTVTLYEQAEPLKLRKVGTYANN